MATNLEFIKSVDITSSQSSTSIDNIFSDKYDVYKVVLSGIKTVGTDSVSLDMRLLDSTGTIITSSNYDWAYLDMNAGSSFVESRNTTATAFVRITAIDNPDSGNTVMYFYNPYDSSSYTFTQWQSASYFSGVMEGYKAIGVHHSAETIRGIHLVELVGTRPYDTGKISVYGVK